MRALRPVLATTAVACALLGCGDPLADGGYLGDATIRMHAVVQGTLPGSQHAAVAVLWLGYSALAENALVGVETSVLPVTKVDFPPRFTCDLLSPPPGAGAYTLPGGVIVPAFLRLGLLVVFDDADQDGRFAIDDRGRLTGADRLLARSTSHALLYLDSAPREPQALDARGAILSNWEAASARYNLVVIDTPPMNGHAVGDATIVFTPAEGELSL